MPAAGEPRAVMDDVIVREKSAQAHELLADAEVDCWLTFCRETAEMTEPCLPFVLGFDVVWPTAVVYGADDSHVVIGRHDAPTAEALGVHEVHPYDESLADDLVGVLDEIEPEEIAVNFSADDAVADGLTHGMYRRLESLFAGTAHEGKLVSAGELVARLRGVKSSTERDRIVAAAEESRDLLVAMADAWAPDWAEADVAGWLHDRMREAGHGSAWSWDYCPTVHHGADSEVGHTMPGDLVLPDGEVLHVDFGVEMDGYAADLQRLFFHGDAHEIPEGLRSAFDDVRDAIEAGRAVLEPGVSGHQVDRAARELVTDRGWPAYRHALGHQVGRNAHDGGTLLGPRWDRYGQRPEGTVRDGEIYTLELGVDTEWGYLGLEEMVEVTADGNEYLVEPQRELRTL